MQQPTRTPNTASYLTPMCSFRWPLRQGVPGTIRRWNWYRRLEDGRQTLQAIPGSLPSSSSSCPWHYRGGMRSHFKTHSQPASSLQSVVSYSLHCALASGALYCNRSCLCLCVFVAGGRCPNLTTASARAVFASL